MFERIRNLLARNGISLCAPIALADCKITRGYLLERAGIGESGTAVMFAISPSVSGKTPVFIFCKTYLF